MAETTAFAVIGATGQQGGAVVDALLERGVGVIGVVRDPSSARSRALADRGVELRVGDQEDEDSLVDALRDVAGLFFMATFSDDVEGEVRRGSRVADAAARADVPVVVYSSVGGADRQSGVPHFESKRRVEEHLASLLGDRARFVRPVYFMDNLDGMLGDDDPFVLRMPMPGSVPLELVAVRDIGRVSATLLLDPQAIEGDGIEIAGDRLTPDEMAAAIGDALGREARFEQVPVDALPSDDLKAMFRWFVDTPAYRADAAGTRRLDPDVWNLRTWLSARGGAEQR